ncbi:MAG: hypothetical protein HYV07_20160 [Deltaproteobacteria bacterium]|nr:hypothetical protein [Deltaproteobacteria bacterium]
MLLRGSFPSTPARIAGLAFVAGCGPNQALSFEAETDDLVLAVSLRAGEIAELRRLDPDEISVLSADEAEHALVLVTSNSELVGLGGEPVETRLLNVRKTSDSAPPDSCGRCPLPALSQPQVFGPGYACPLPRSTRIFGEKPDDEAGLYDAIRLDSPGACECRRPGPDRRPFEVEPIDPPLVTLPIETAALTSDGRLVLAGRHLFARERPDGTFSMTQKNDLFPGQIAAAGVSRDGRIQLAIALPSAPGQAHSFQVSDVDPEDARIVRTHSWNRAELGNAWWAPGGEAFLLSGSNERSDPVFLLCPPGREEACTELFPDGQLASRPYLPPVLTPHGWTFVLRDSGLLTLAALPDPGAILETITTETLPGESRGILRTTNGAIRWRLLATFPGGDGAPPFALETGWLLCRSEPAGQAASATILGARTPADFDGPIEARELILLPGLRCHGTRSMGRWGDINLSSGQQIRCSVDECGVPHPADEFAAMTIARSEQRWVAFDARSAFVSTSSSPETLALVFGPGSPPDPVISIDPVLEARFVAVTASGLVRTVSNSGEILSTHRISERVVTAAYDPEDDELIIVTPRVGACGNATGSNILRVNLATGEKHELEAPSDLDCILLRKVVALDHRPSIQRRALVIGQNGFLGLVESDRVVRVDVSWDDPATLAQESDPRPGACTSRDDLHVYSDFMSEERLFLDLGAARGGAVAVGCDRLVVRIDTLSTPPRAYRFALEGVTEGPGHPVFSAVLVECPDDFALGVRHVVGSNSEYGEVTRAFPLPRSPLVERMAPLDMRHDSDNDVRAGPGFSSVEIVGLVGRSDRLSFVFEHAAHHVGSVSGQRFDGAELRDAAELATGETLLGDALGSLFLSR